MDQVEKQRRKIPNERADLGADVGRRAILRMAGAGIAATVMAGSFAGAARADGGTAKASDAAIAPPQCEFVYESLVTLEPAVEMGTGPHGIRRYIPITGGTFSGPRIKGVVLPGGADWQTQRADGVTEVDALYSVKADDGAVIIVRNRGIWADGGAYFKTVPQFEAPSGPHDWLNKAVFIGSVAGSPRPGEVVVRVFRVL